MLDRLYDAFGTLRQTWARFSESRIGQRILSVLRWAFLAGIVAYLGYQLTTIGWKQVWTSAPTTPWFYVLLLLMYATLPAAETVIYGTVWDASSRTLLPALLRKRVLNNDVLGYSGEAYFYLWARRELPLDSLDALRTIKDNVIISSIASTSVAFSLLAIFFLSGQIELLRQYLPSETSTIAAGVAVLILVVSVGINFRRAIFSLPARLLWLIGASHLARFLLNNGFQVLQWALVIDDVPIGTWITLLALYIVIQQVPFVPSRGLVFVSAGVELSGALQIPAAALASMLLTQNIIDRILNFATYVGTAALDTATVEEPDEAEDFSLSEQWADASSTGEEIPE